MNNLPSIRKSLALIALPLLIATVFACNNSSESGGETIGQACPVIESSGAAPDAPPALPYIFEGTAYVDGEPAPSGVKIWVQMARSWSAPSRTMDDGNFLNVIHGPIHDEDFDHGFVFCIGEMDGNSVMAVSTPVPYEQQSTFHSVKDTHVDFPNLP